MLPLLHLRRGRDEPRENVTDWALAQFRARYGDDSISRRDIFHYVYGLLHHPGYRERHADSLRRELPRIPLAPDFAAFRDARARSWRVCTSTMSTSAPGNWTGKRRTARWDYRVERCARSNAYSPKTATTASSTRCSTTTR